MEDFILTDDQLKAINIVYDRYVNGYKHAVISGYAGTGKSTIVSIIIDKLSAEFKIRKSEIIYCSYTGKASLVLRQKGNTNVSTLHKLLYIPQFNTFKGDYDFIPKGRLDKDYRIIVVDEVSMVPNEMVKLLADSGSFIIFLGDEEQIPPIDSDEDNHLLLAPHARLTEIMRQEEESEIIQVATAVREGKSLKPFKGKDVQIIKQDDLTTGMLLWADQIICSTNQARRELNNLIRTSLGFTSTSPEVGDKIICLHNYWDIQSIGGYETYPLINGTIGNIETLEQAHLFWQRPYSSSKVNLKSDNVYFSNLLVDTNLFKTGNPTFNSKEQFQMKKSRNPKIRFKIPLQFDYGYVITGWKAQGSEWNKVLIIQENFPSDLEERRKFDYTCITRAREKVIIVLRD